MFTDAQHKKYNLMNDTWCLYAITVCCCSVASFFADSWFPVAWYAHH